MFTQDRHFWAVDFLASLARRALAAGDDRVQDDLVADPNPVHAWADGVDHARPVRAKDRRQRPFGQAAGDEHVRMVQGHI